GHPEPRLLEFVGVGSGRQRLAFGRDENISWTLLARNRYASLGHCARRNKCDLKTLPVRQGGHHKTNGPNGPPVEQRRVTDDDYLGRSLGRHYGNGNRLCRVRHGKILEGWIVGCPLPRQKEVIDAAVSFPDVKR